MDRGAGSDALIPGDPLFQQHAFWLQEIRSHAAHTLSDEVEDAIGKMELNGSNAWAQLQEYMTSTVAVTMDGQITRYPRSATSLTAPIQPFVKSL